MGRPGKSVLCALLLLGGVACSGNPAAPPTNPSVSAATPAAPTPAPSTAAPWTVLSTQSRKDLLRAFSARSNADFLELHVETNIGWTLQGANEGSSFWIFLDTDRDRRTGCRSNPWSAADVDLGAEFMVTVSPHWGQAVYSCRDGWWWDWQPLGRLEAHPDQHWFEVAVPLESIGRPASVDLAVVCWIGISAYPDQMPPAGHVTFAAAAR